MRVGERPMEEWRSPQENVHDLYIDDDDLYTEDIDLDVARRDYTSGNVILQ